MRLAHMPEAVTDWSAVPAIRVLGAAAAAKARTRQVGDVQLRIVEYEPGYLADHWCAKGHVMYVVDGELAIEHEDGSDAHALCTGMSWHVADDERPAHRVRSATGATVFILD